MAKPMTKKTGSKLVQVGSNLAKENARQIIQAFIESSQVKEAVGRVLMGKEQFMSAARQWVMICGEVEKLYVDAEKLDVEIKKDMAEKKYRLKREERPVQQFLAELNLADDKATVSKMRTIGRAVFLKKAEYEKKLPAGKETLYITAQALGAGDRDTFNSANAEQNFRKIIEAEDYRSDAPRSTVLAIANQVLGLKKRKSNKDKVFTDAPLLRAVIAVRVASPEINMTIPPALKNKLSAVADMQLANKKLTNEQFSAWSSV